MEAWQKLAQAWHNISFPELKERLEMKIRAKKECPKSGSMV